MSAENDGEAGRAGRDRGLLDRVDTILALGIIAVCAWLYYVTTTFDQPSALLGQNVLPEDLPQGLLIIIGFLALLMPVEHLFERSRWPKIEKSRSEPIRILTWITMGFLIVFMAAAPYLGTLPTIFLISLLMPLLWGERRFLLVGAFSIGFTAAVTYVFAIILGVHFEPGVFGISLV